MNRQNVMHMVTILNGIVVFGWKIEIHTLVTHTEILTNFMFLVPYHCWFFGASHSQLEKSSADLPFLKLTARAPARKLPSKGNEKVFPLPSIFRCELWDMPLKLDPPSGKPRLNWKYSRHPDPSGFGPRIDPIQFCWVVSNPSKIL